MTKQLEIWGQEFGTAYTDRNVVDWNLRLPAFEEMLSGLPVKQILEVGCNRGHNLIAVKELLGTDNKIVGVEPNQHAREIAQQADPKIEVLDANLFALPFPDGHFDLVFTACVLIHVALEDLPSALDQLYRVSNRYILAIEYFADEETTIHYRGYDDLLWKRDFRDHYQTQFPGLNLIKSGYWDSEHGFDRSNWWLFEKSKVSQS